MTTFEETSDTIYCRFSGDINSIACTDVSTVLAEHLDDVLTRKPGICVRFDLKETRYICSSFLRLCLLYCKKAGKEHFRIENASEDIKKIFGIAGLNELIVLV